MRGCQMSKWLSRHQGSYEKSRLKIWILGHTPTGGKYSHSMYEVTREVGKGEKRRALVTPTFKAAETALPNMFTVTELQSEEECKGH